MFRLFPCMKIHKDIDLDTPIYRFIPITYIYEIFEQKKLFFQRIDKWDDPWENPARFVITNETSPLYVAKLLHNINQFYATCWSTGEATEGLWKVYSTDKCHVRIKTTVRKLLESSNITVESGIDGFIAPVIYKDLEDVSLLAQMLHEEKDYIKYYLPLFVKRKTFAYEKEIRFVICQLTSIDNPEMVKAVAKGKESCIYVNLKNTDFIEEIELDPRLSHYEYEQQMDYLGVLSSLVRWNSLYKPPLQIEIEKQDEYALETIPNSIILWHGSGFITESKLRELMSEY